HLRAVELQLRLLRRVDQDVRPVHEDARARARIGNAALACLRADTAAAARPRDRHRAARAEDLDLEAQVPIGCQTVFSSRNAEISYRLWASVAPRTTRLTFSAAARSRSARRPSAPVRSIAFTSMCDASQGASSARRPVRTLTTPPGTSLVASASAS